MQASGLTEIIPFICISAIWGQHLASWFLVVASNSCWIAGIVLPFRHPLGSEIYIWRHRNHWWLRHPCLLIWQEILHINTPNTTCVACSMFFVHLFVGVLAYLDGITKSMDMSLGRLQEWWSLTCCNLWGAKSRTKLSDWTELAYFLLTCESCLLCSS